MIQRLLAILSHDPVTASYDVIWSSNC